MTALHRKTYQALFIEDAAQALETAPAPEDTGQAITGAHNMFDYTGHTDDNHVHLRV
jgi:hypothetical protein